MGASRECRDGRLEHAATPEAGRGSAPADDAAPADGRVGVPDLAAVIDVPAVQALMDDVAGAIGIAVAIVDPHGRVLVAAGWQDICTKFHRVHPETCRNCLESDTRFAQGLSTGTFKLYRCRNNLWDMATPITLGDTQVGSLFLGQFLFDDEPGDVEAFRAQARRCGFDEQEYLAALARVPRWSREKANRAMAFHAGLAKLISELSYGNVKLARTLAERDRLLNSLQRSEEELRVSLVKYKTLFAAFPQGISVSDSAGRIVEANLMADSLLGVPHEEQARRQVDSPEWHLVRPDGTPMPSDEYASVRALKENRRIENVEMGLVRSTGEIIWMSVTASPLPIEGGGVIITYSDITARKQAEEALRRSEGRLQKIFDILPVGLWLADANGNLVRGNAAGVRIWGADPRVEPSEYGILKARRVPSGAALAPDDRALAHTLREGATVVDEVLEIDAFDGKTRTILNCTAPVLDDDGTVEGAIMVNQDITELRQAVEALREGETRYRTFIDASSDLVFLKDEAFRYLISNRANSAFLGKSEAEVIGRTDFDLMPSVAAACCRASDQEALARGASTVAEEVVGARAYQTVKFPVPLPGGRLGVGGYIRDITDRTQAEAEREKLRAQLSQAQKMESVGRLAGGVAHDFNNLLMGIMGYADLCRDGLPPEHPVCEWLGEITQEAQRSAGIVRQLLAFARKQTIAPKALDLSEAVEGLLKMLRRLIGEDIDLAWRSNASIWPIKMDPGQIDQILTNLCVNARDAIRGVGRIAIEAANVTIEEAHGVGTGEVVPGRYVMLAVSDNGCGMDKDALEHAFEPFFTTKASGEGTGLGLATVYGIVKQNHGFVNVDSEPGKGTTFRIYLPGLVGEALPAAGVPGPVARPGGDETVLLVEDEKSIRVTAQLFLTKLGYTVLDAETPEVALGLAAEHAGAIDLLITDVVMPGMSGRDLAERLAGANPGMRCLFISGYTANVIAHRGVLEEDVDFLGKPFSRDDLARKVREVLERE